MTTNNERPNEWKTTWQTTQKPVFVGTLERPHHGQASVVYGAILPGSGYWFTSPSTLAYNTRLPLRKRKYAFFYPFHQGYLYTFLFAFTVILMALFVSRLFQDIVFLSGLSILDTRHVGYIVTTLVLFFLFYYLVDRIVFYTHTPVYYT